ncbi:MBL fold metallo-hydrolase [Dactylosporangium sp. CA-092794]|uniref:MBL fold metallo-hydrolase n=1 Tax=Dactylosporangium sp. CA-092794 TaxID=3239929 RepID=UPI003D90A0C9
MTDYPYPDPDIDPAAAIDVASDVVVISNRNVPLVPNVGIVGGTEAVLVVDTGLGPGNADKVLKFALDHARGRKLYLTTTHFHPEHAFGASSFAGQATWIVNAGQARDLAMKGPGYLRQFRTLGEPVAKALDGAALATPDVVYDGDYDLDLGGRVVSLRPTGRAHTRSDQVVTVPDSGVLFTGDLAEPGQFAIFPWFPPYDVDVSGLGWIEVMRSLRAGDPSVVVPGHNAIGDAAILDEVRTYLEWLRDATWRRRDSGLRQETLTEEIIAEAIARHPQWEGREWIAPAVACLCQEHAH